MKSNIRTGVIGVGAMGKNHARIYKELSNFVAIAEPRYPAAPVISILFFFILFLKSLSSTLI